MYLHTSYKQHQKDKSVIVVVGTGVFLYDAEDTQAQDDDVGLRKHPIPLLF